MLTAMGALQLLTVGLASMSASQEEAQTREGTWWDVGLVVKEAPVIETRGRFGKDWGWFEPLSDSGRVGTGELDFVVEESAGSLIVRVRHENVSSLSEVVVRLKAGGAEVQCASSSCIVLDPLAEGRFEREAAGVVCLFTEGKSAALDFEVFELEGLYRESFFGHVPLGAAGVGFAEGTLRQQLGKDTSSFQAARVVVLERGEQSRGWVDAFGRRQGVWTLLAADGKKRLEQTWADGRPHGRLALFDEAGRLWYESSFQDGLEHGDCYRWHENGELASFGHFMNGVPRGLQIDFDPDGTKVREERVDQGGPSGEFLRELARLQTRN